MASASMMGITADNIDRGRFLRAVSPQARGTVRHVRGYAREWFRGRHGRMPKAGASIRISSFRMSLGRFRQQIAKNISVFPLAPAVHFFHHVPVLHAPVM